MCYICDNYICLVHGYTHTFLIPFFIFKFLQNLGRSSAGISSCYWVLLSLGLCYFSSTPFKFVRIFIRTNPFL